MSIHVLDKKTVEQIAAGEVVERPSSVVKELTENAIDAGASAVTVEIRNGGIDLIRVTDNGTGIPADEIPTAFLSHATSKISDASDLFSIASLGFRGEALPSIAAVTELEVISKTKGSLSGTDYVLSGGKEVKKEEIGAPDGTTFLVRDIFFNTPVRKKFLKSAMTEASYIENVLEKLALSHPGISFRFINNGSTRLSTSGNGKVKDLIYALFGRETANAVLPVDYRDDCLSVTGYVGKPEVLKGSRAYENYFINGRFVKSNVITKAIEDAFQPFLMQHRYPFTLLYITMEPGFFDVNVHPTKMELRFQKESSVYDSLKKAITETLSHKEFIPGVSLSEEKKTQSEKRETGASEAPAYRAPEPFEKARIREEGKYGQSVPAVRPDRSVPEKNGKPDTAHSEALQTTAGDRERVNSTDISEDRRKSDLGASVPGRKAESTVPKIMGERADSAHLTGRSEVCHDTEALRQKAEIRNDTEPPRQKTESRPDTEALRQKTETGPDVESLRQKADISSDPEQSDKPEESTASDRETASPPAQADLFRDGFLSEAGIRKHRMIGQLFETYWLIQMDDSLYIMDQHAAHEKVLYERKMKELAGRKVASQSVSPPIMVSLSPKEELMLNRFMSYFSEIGYEISSFGGREYAISAVPDDLYGLDVKRLFEDILSEMSQEVNTKNSELIRSKVASASCKAAVKGNYSMSEAEASHLISELLTLENPYACPHGRPTIISITKAEIEKKFKRIV